jgi:cell division protein FtsI/penicillin-binding protein 2
MSRLAEKPALRYLPTVSLLAFGVAALSQADKQIFSRAAILEQGEKSGRFIHTATDVARRGTIVSRDGKALAQASEAAVLGIRFDRVPQVEGFFVALSVASGIPAAEFQELSQTGAKFREWKREYTAEQVAEIDRVKSLWRADGVSIRRGGAREYPLGEAASGLIGFTNEEGPQAGLELSQDKVLKGTDGKVVGMIDRQGQMLPMRLDPKTEQRRDGQTITLTLDSELQQLAAQSVASAVRLHKADSGVAIIMMPETGDILAMASAPTFDPENPSAARKAKIAIGYNPSYMGAWEPGSTFKILTLAKALEDGHVQMNDHIQCSGSLQVWKGTRIHCDRSHGAHGSIDPTRAIAASCNVSAATWAKRIGHEDMAEYMRSLGLLSKTKLGLPLEQSGSYANDYAWGSQLANWGFGQAVQTTPVALISAFSTLANHGVRMEPRLISQVGDKPIPPRPAARIFSEEVCADVLNCMQATFESDAGTAHGLRIAGYELGGKTGTAQKLNAETVGKKLYVSNFVGFLPAKNPKVVILVMIDNPQGGKYYGGTVAGPVFKELAKAAVRRLGIPKTSEETSESRRPSKRAKPNLEVTATPVPAMSKKEAPPGR